MPVLLKYATKDEIPEELRDAAKEITEGEEKGRFTVSVVSKSKVDEFRDRNIETSKKLEESVESISKFKSVLGEDIDLEAFATELAELRETKRRVDDGKIKDESQIDALVKERTEAMRTKHGEELQQRALELAKLKNEANEYKALFKRTFIDRAVSEAVTLEDLGVHPAAIADVTKRAYEIFNVQDDNSLLPKKNGNTVWGEDGVTPMTVREWIDTTLRKEVPYYFKPSNGGGSGGGNGSDGQGGLSAEDLSKMTPRQKLEFANKQSAKSAGKR
jgi:hypothetical protein